MSKILVIGDSCTDMFQYGVCDRMCPEAPVPIFNPTKITTTGGMAINVADNVESLGSNCEIITNDFRPAKTRYVDQVSNQILLRVDVNDKVKRIKQDTLRQIKFTEFDAVIISDYNKGFLLEEDIEFITHHPLVFMDTKKKLGSWANLVKFIKLNKKEYQESYDYFQKTDHPGLVMTQGGDGAVLNRQHVFSIENDHPVRDLSGAGDTFLAALVVEYLKNNCIEDAIRFANKCAAWVVTQKGVVAVNPDKI